MSFFQAFLIALIGYLGTGYCPWLGFVRTVVGKPLVAGAIIGAILGDVKTGIIIGASIQAIFIGLVTPGLSVPGDVNYAAFIGIPLAIVSGATPEYAVSLSVPLSFLGVASTYLVLAVNVVFVHWQESLIEKGNLKLAINVPLIGNITQFATRFFPIFLANYYGATYVTKLVNLIPESVGNILIVLGGMLPAVGFGLLLSQIVDRNSDILYFLIGFLLVSVFNVSIIPATIIAVFLAYLEIKNNKIALEKEAL